MMLPHRYFRPVEPLLDDFMWLMEVRQLRMVAARCLAG